MRVYTCVQFLGHPFTDVSCDEISKLVIVAKWTKGPSVESTAPQGVPTSHYPTRNTSVQDGRWRSGRAARWTYTPARIFKDPARPPPIHRHGPTRDLHVLPVRRTTCMFTTPSPPFFPSVTQGWARAARTPRCVKKSLSVRCLCSQRAYAFW